MLNRVISTGLGLLGGVGGGLIGYHLFFWITRQGLYGLVIPGAFVGLGCGLLSRHRSALRGGVCALGALGLGLYTEWKFEPFIADDRFGYLVTHFFQLRPMTQLMIGIAVIVAFYLGKDAMIFPTADEGKPRRDDGPDLA